MAQINVTPFDTIESAQDFIRVLSETIVEARQEVERDYERELAVPPSRHRDALQIALYNLGKLEQHMARSQRILNDLRSLRRLLFAERKFHRTRALGTDSATPAESIPVLVTLIPPPKRVGRSSKMTTGSEARAIPA